MQHDVLYFHEADRCNKPYIVTKNTTQTRRQWLTTAGADVSVAQQVFVYDSETSLCILNLQMHNFVNFSDLPYGAVQLHLYALSSMPY